MYVNYLALVTDQKNMQCGRPLHAKRGEFLPATMPAIHSNYEVTGCYGASAFQERDSGCMLECNLVDIFWLCNVLSCAGALSWSVAAWKASLR